MAAPFARMPPSTPHGQYFFDQPFYPNNNPLGPSSPAALAGGSHGQSPSLAALNLNPQQLSMFLGSPQPQTPSWTGPGGGRGFHVSQSSVAMSPNPLGNFKRGNTLHQSNHSLAVGMGGNASWMQGGGHQPRPSLSLNFRNPTKKNSLAPPPMTPGVARGGLSPSKEPSTPLPVLTPVPAKPKKIVVRLPRESLEALSPIGGGFIIGGFTMWSRTPKVWKDGEMEKLGESTPPEIIGAEENPEVITEDGLPPTLDIYLPGKHAWKDVLCPDLGEYLASKGIFESTDAETEALSQHPSPNPMTPLLLNPPSPNLLLQPGTGRPLPLPRPHPALPILAVPQPISPFFPGSTFSQQQQFVSSPAHSPTVERGGPLPFKAPVITPSDSAMSAEAELKEKKAKEMSLTELARGFGFEDFEEEREREREMEMQRQRMRKTSGELIKTQRDEEDEVDGKKLRRYSDGVEEGRRRRHHSKSYSVSEGAYSKTESDREGDENEHDDDDEEYSNPSDEERARKRKFEEKKSKSVPNPDHWLDGGDDESIISNPSEEEHLNKMHIRISHSANPSDSSNNAHRVNNNFQFPRRPLPVPPSLPSTANSYDPNGLQAQQAAAATRHSRPPSLTPSFVFGRPQDPPPQLPTLRFGSGSGFGSISSTSGIDAPPSNPGPPPPVQSTFGKLNAFAKEFKPSFTFRNPVGAPTANFSNPPPPPHARALSPALFGRSQTATATFPKPVPVPVPMTMDEVRKDNWLSLNPSESETDVFNNKAVSGSITSDDVRYGGEVNYLASVEERRVSAPLVHQSSQNFNTLSKNTLGRNLPVISIQDPNSLFGTSTSPESKRRLPIPEFYTSGENESQSYLSHPRYSIDAGMGDGVALPSIARSKGGIVDDSSKTPTGPTMQYLRRAEEEEMEDDTSDMSRTDDDDYEDEDGMDEDYEADTEEGEDYLLGQIEEILEEKLAEFRKDLSGLANFKAEFDNLKQDALLDAFTTRVASALESIITPELLTAALSRQAGLKRIGNFSGNFGYTGLPEIEHVPSSELQVFQEVVNDNQLKIEATLNQALAAIINHVTENTSSQHQSRILPVPSADAFSDAIISKLKSQGVIDDVSRERERLAEVVDGVLETLKPVLEQQRDSRSRSISDPFLDPPSPNASLEVFIKVLDERLSKSPANIDALANQIVENLIPQVTALTSKPLDLEEMIVKLSDAVKPQITQLIDLTSDKKETANIISAQLAPHFESLRPVGINYTTLAEELTKILPSSQFILDSVREDIKNALSVVKSSLAVPRDTLNVEALAARLSEALTGSFRDGDIIKKLVSQIQNLDVQGGDILERHDLLANTLNLLRQCLEEKLEAGNLSILDEVKKSHNHVKDLTAAVTSRIDLETSMSRLRQENIKLSSEKTMIQELWQTEKSRLLADTKDLTAQLNARSSEVQMLQTELRGKEADVEAHKNFANRLQERLGESDSHAQNLSAQLSSARERETVWHQTDLEHTRQVGEMQAKVRMMEVEVNVAKRQTESTNKSLERLQKEKEEDAISYRQNTKQLREEQKELEKDFRARESERVKEMNKMREAKASLEGQVSLLEKRLASQDQTISNLQNASAKAKQSLASSTQRVSELEKNAKELGTTKLELARLEGELRARNDVEKDLTQSRASEQRLQKEVNDYRTRFEEMEREILAMRESVGKELQDAQVKAESSTEEISSLKAEIAKLQKQLATTNTQPQYQTFPPPDRSQSTTPNYHQSNGFVNHASSSSHLQHTTSRDASSVYESDFPRLGQESSKAGKPISVTPHYPNNSNYPPPPVLQRQNTGGSTGTVRTRFIPSPTPSRMGKPAIKDDDGWWG